MAESVATLPDNIRQLLQAPLLCHRTPIADPDLGGDGHIDILLGAAFSNCCHVKEVFYSDDKSSVVTNTIFRWTLNGTTLAMPTSFPSLKVTVSTADCAEQLDQKLWEMDHGPGFYSNVTKECNQG